MLYRTPREESILKYNHGVKSRKIEFIIYADMESLLEKIDTCHNNSEKLSITKINTAQLVAIYYLCILHLMSQKTSIIIAEVKIV